MSVRVAYVQRAGRGLVVRSVRLVGQTGDVSWPQNGAASRDDSVDQNPAIYSDIAAWLKSNLQGARSRDSLELVCLDAGGSVYSWLSAPSQDPALVALLARQGSSAPDESTTPVTTPVSFYAPTPLDSAVQPLPADADHPVAAAPGKKIEAAPAVRTAALAATDLPARMLVDALDSAGVRVGEVATIWHAMALAWDRGAAQPLSGADVASSSPVTAVVMTDDNARLLWCWSHKGQLLAGGSVRLRTVPSAHEGDPAQPVCTRSDTARIVTDWVSWSMQLGRSPQRVVCVLPEHMGGDDPESLRPGEVGEEIARLWPGASVDAALHDDPLGATLRRIVTHLEATPATTQATPGTALVATSTRPGGAHRSMYVWLAASLALAGVVLGVLGWRFRQSAAKADNAADLWRASWKEPLKQAVPDLKPFPGMGELKTLEKMIQDRESAGKLPDKVERAKPVMNELEGITLVLSTPKLELKSLKVPTDAPIQVVAIANSTAEAESVLEAFRKLGNTELEGWSASYRQVPQSDRVEGTYTARWSTKGVPR
mgnify:CR=1 FL=1